MIGELLGVVAARSMSMQWHHYLFFLALIAGGYALTTTCVVTPVDCSMMSGRAVAPTSP